ncbi:immunoglobulin lambda-1 light chain-like [Perca flavescens]|uniref:immunoglobulin lambda-1 light chain-like n=1 Tax=Perca flavescens TaxID=8167 RepID=UPI00106E2C74|nr:immunoglobulin lambda-1 light chain-like [Perca flavescens]
MIRRLAVLILLSTMYLIQTAEVPHQISLTVVEVGRNVTLECPVSETGGKFFHWYKQPLGYTFQSVITEAHGKLTIRKEFNNSRFTATKRDAQYFLTITNISKEDEATYFCHYGATYTESSNGFFLAVNDHNQQKSVYVKQSPETESVQPGDSVTLQCSLLSKTKGNTDQCPGEHSVYWFRSGSGESHPGIIYTHSDEEEERSCVYSLSKTIQNSSDTGTYYCAVVTYGEILFGEGTKVETRSELEPVVIVLGVLLACCVTVIAALIFYGNQRKVCEDCKGALSASHHRDNDRSTVDQSNDLDGEARAMNYAGLYSSTMEVKRGKRKKRESPPECVYSVVRADNHNQHQPSL